MEDETESSGPEKFSAEDENELRKDGYLDDDSSETPPSDIVSYNELRSCADLFRMHRQGILKIQPDFQRDFVWSPAAQTRFVDSLVKQLPIPSMCFAFDYLQNQWQVIDGLQRISTIIKFLDIEKPWKLNALEDIDPKLAGKQTSKKTGSSLMPRFHSLVENTSIPVNVLRCDFSKQRHMEYLFTIFHRLNSGGQKLNNQEIRNCIFSGSFNELLRELDQNVEWRQINDMKRGKNLRFVKQELILRVFALGDRLNQYEGNVAKFLNTYMLFHRNAEPEFLNSKKELFTRAVSILYSKCLNKTITEKYPIAVLEASLVGIASNLVALENEDTEATKVRWLRLLRHDNFSNEALKEGLSKKDRVKGRIETAFDLFGA